MNVRNESPRPYLVRNSDLINLNGKWEFSYDFNNEGHKNKWFNKHDYETSIIVPFPHESKLSGLNDKRACDHLWYKRTLNLSVTKGKRYILNFNGVDYYSEIYINSIFVKLNEGGYNSFKVDITDYLVSGENDLVVYTYDPARRQDFPRGKQYWKDTTESIFYTRTSGIYKNVYLEVINSETYLDEYYFTSDIDKGTLDVKLNFKGIPSKVSFEVYFKGEFVTSKVVSNSQESLDDVLQIFNKEDIYDLAFHDRKKCWSPSNPALYDIKISLLDKDNNKVDEVTTYFAMRKVHYKNGIVYLNNEAFYQKLVLIQGYWEDGILTYPSIKDLEKDIVLAKEMGFNGGRMHQKIEDPYYYYLCDKLGFIAWLEMPSAQIYNSTLVTLLTKEWVEIVKNNYNHPSILVYVPLNESWGVPRLESDVRQREFQKSLVHLTKSLDSSRLVVGNDGWEICSGDLISVHNYRHGAKDELIVQERFNKSLLDKESIINSVPASRRIVLDGYDYKDKPILLTEFGGISFVDKNSSNWGYTVVSNEEDYLSELTRIYEGIKNSKSLVGYCYTQLYDVEQEVNGLLKYNRDLKVDTKKIKELNDSIPSLISIIE